MPLLTPYLSFDGNCAEAMRLYERALGGRLTRLMKYSEMPGAPELPAGGGDRIMHARLELGGGAVLMAGDAMPGQTYEPMKGFSVTVSFDTVEEGKRAFDALAEGGRIAWGFEPAFWAERAGMLVDRFGTPWIINGKLTDI